MHATIDCPGPRVAICRLSGSVDGCCLEQLRATMAACAAFSEVHIDLSGVVFIDSGALGVIVGGTRRIREGGGAVVAWGARSNIGRHLTAVGLQRICPLRSGLVPPVGPPALIAS